LFDKILEILRSTVEWQSLGYNALTITFLATLITTSLGGWGYIRQARAVWKKKSGESVSVTLFSYFGAFFLAFLVYGIATRRIAVAFNGLLGFFHVPILWGLWKFKGFSRAEKVLFWMFLGMIPAMAFLPRKDLMLMVFMFGTLIPVAKQPYEMWQAKSAGVMDIGFVAVFLFSTFFWTIYAFAVRDWVMEIVNPIALVIVLAIAALWFKYSRKEIPRVSLR